MTCQPERVTAWVDGAVGDAERAELNAHLAECDQCQAQAQAEREIRERLRALGEMDLPAGFEHALRLRLKSARMRNLRVALPLAAGLAVAALFGRNAAHFVSWELARDHGHCFGFAKLPAEVWSNDSSAVASWFEARGRVLPFLPDKVGALELVGGRRCPLVDRSVAHLYYVGGHRHLSLFVVPGAVRFDETYSATRRGLSIRLLRMSGLVVGLVAEHEGDVSAFEDAFTTVAARNAVAAKGLRSAVDPYALGLLRLGFSSGAVAQLGARVNGIHEVTGSIPVSSTNLDNDLESWP